ncbi:hypothetical protein A2291_01650 [candidate division WOR-1 bacterium RIFOXYB2_FULL_42_35]|uniref:Endolytic murein transglycosylase n=1 Tax=candidate division WOR-1 bacterium RIFOXYC2_FULL_41_25 TaxID=1802586 RepID=A0A1F4TQB7_UNCSA|nr:MAG: hypothetical protein A2247_03450 [candidate division WOR-1 bacterium RIFOXYA2_FULL_41_14]OGC25450.1 MAG: hypothetical protein A2291_01650 [candidate division WOR-1 bacterium RIFOXYB2_FULL_42_35]OGC34856.1 MAG: hypothetical protein A2462_05585 [candidate division WOR-1 bacterium RIFOXYC2_FULL_41_25]OGC42965.1 MAG: hypothetical protein A2548_06910 [candidate division WOR-1 bacterium RIFOXYD2_FULL_41_8]
MNKIKDKSEKIKFSRILSFGFGSWNLFVALILALGISSLLFAISLLQAANPYDSSLIEVAIAKGASTAMVQQILKDSQVIKQHSSFAFAAKVLGISKRIQAGKYAFSPSQPLIIILLKLKKGEIVSPEQVPVTFPEGSSIYKMGEILKKNQVGNGLKFQSLAKNGIKEDLRNRHWEVFKYIPSESLEGYLYPDTYLLLKDTSNEVVVERMLNRFEEQVLPFWRTAAQETKYNLHEILTLASIIEKEAQKPEDRAIISSVYHNRLKIYMPLESCPTIKYALNDPTPKVYLEQLKVKSPYNTYLNYGLPPGPICNPGIKSIKAAVYPAKTKYLFFVAKSDGSHIFSETWAEHQKARAEVRK